MWLDDAKKLCLGGSRRIICDEAGCGKDDSMKVSHTVKGYSAYCFRCGTSRWERHDRRTLSELLEAARRVTKSAKAVKLPQDFTRDVPAWAAVWYMQYGISPENAADFGIGYSHELGRIVIPVYDLSGLVAVQMRAVYPQQVPKYINAASVPIGDILYETVLNPESRWNKAVVVTEDIMSAIKVHLATGLPTAALMGTATTPGRVNKLRDSYSSVIIWLDGDDAGIRGARNLRGEMEMQNVSVINVRTARDPKTYNRDQIRSFIQQAIDNDRHHTTPNYEVSEGLQATDAGNTD